MSEPLKLSRYETFADPALEVADSRLKELVAYWRERAGRRLMPARADISPRDLVRHLPALCLINVHHKTEKGERAMPDFSFRLVGTGLADMFCSGATGKSIDRVIPQPAAGIAGAVLAAIVEHRRPLRTFGYMDWWPGGAETRFECLHLPLTRTDGRVDIILNEFLAFQKAGQIEPRILSSRMTA
jgi:hypothetical protein